MFIIPEVSYEANSFKLFKFSAERFFIGLCHFPRKHRHNINAECKAIFFFPQQPLQNKVVDGGLFVYFRRHSASIFFSIFQNANEIFMRSENLKRFLEAIP